MQVLCTQYRQISLDILAGASKKWCWLQYYPNISQYQQTDSIKLYGAYIVPPENMPALPNPETARPTMNAADEGADALTADPKPNMKNDVRKMAFVG
jgi:hypothetical protein